VRAFVTGLAGFAGRHLVAELRSAGDEVSGLVKPGTETPPGVAAVEADILDAGAVERALAAARPDAVYHLAALSHVGESWQRKREFLETNFLGSLSVLEAALRLRPPPRLLLVGSAEEYGSASAAAGPIPETAPLRPVTPYGVSKAAQELLGQQYALAHGLPVLLVRAFNHAGAGQEPTFVVSEWARAIAEIELGRRPPVLEVGDLEAVRDFTDVRDVVRLYRLLVEKGRVAEPYNACSGVGRSLAELLEGLRALARVRFEVKPRPGRRPSDVRAFVGSREKATRELGWEPAVPFEETLRSALDHWRARLAG
jgi:GDP-4-dehydro-6-deoxy-D-mannose reductase